MEKAIIFDFFGVVCSEISSEWFESRGSLHDVDSRYEKYMLPADRGDETEQQLFEALGRVEELPPERIKAEWNTLARINTDLVAFIRELKKTHKVGLCSNAVSDFIRPILKKHGLEDLFDAIVISSEVRSIKPEPQIFTAVLAALGVEAGNAIFTDDNPANIVGAEKVGMRGILFTSVDALKKQIVIA